MASGTKSLPANAPSGEGASTKDPPLARFGLLLADWSERWFPDAFIFAMLAAVIVAVGALAIGATPQTVAFEFGKGFWDLITFTMQMALIIIGGYVVASSPPVARLIEWLAGAPKSGRSTVAYVAALSMLASFLSWGFSLIFSGLLVRELTRRVPRMDYRAAGAAAYLGLGSIWALGLSSSAAQLQANKASMPGLAKNHWRHPLQRDHLPVARPGHGVGTAVRVGGHCILLRAV